MLGIKHGHSGIGHPTGRVRRGPLDISGRWWAVMSSSLVTQCQCRSAPAVWSEISHTLESSWLVLHRPNHNPAVVPGLLRVRVRAFHFTHFPSSKPSSERIGQTRPKFPVVTAVWATFPS